MQSRLQDFRCDTKYAASDKKQSNAIAPTIGMHQIVNWMISVIPDRIISVIVSLMAALRWICVIYGPTVDFVPSKAEAVIATETTSCGGSAGNQHRGSSVCFRSE